MLQQLALYSSDCTHLPVPERLLVTVAFLSALVACATPAANVASSPQYRSIPARYCKVTHAWDLSGNSALPPAVVTCAIALYPPELRAVGQEGEVVVDMMVDSAGVPDSTSIHVIRSNGGKAFEQAVLTASKYVRFAPGGPGSIRPVVVEMPTSFTVGR